MVSGPVRVASAFAPGHITGAFRPVSQIRDPRGRGSVGAGVVLELGVLATARYCPGGRRKVTVTADRPVPLPISADVARRLLGDRAGGLDVRLRHQLPIGQGFGTSASGSLATALAVASVLGGSRTKAIATAHLADLFGGGGLGGVAAILGGGIEVRRRPGIPPFGTIVHTPVASSFLVGIVGPPIPSAGILADPRALARITRAAEGWERIGRHPTLGELFSMGERFTERAGLGPTPVRAVLRGLRRRGATAFQPMFGQSFAALPRSTLDRARIVEWLARSGVPTVELNASPTGPRTG